LTLDGDALTAPGDEDHRKLFSADEGAWRLVRGSVGVVSGIGVSGLNSFMIDPRVCLRQAQRSRGGCAGPGLSVSREGDGVCWRAEAWTTDATAAEVIAEWSRQVVRVRGFSRNVEGKLRWSLEGLAQDDARNSR